MALFHKQKSQKALSTDEATDAELNFLNESFREELRNHGRWYFEKVIKENGNLFKQDLDATITQVNIELKDHITRQLDATIADINTELKEHVAKRLDEQFLEYDKAIKDAQSLALQSLLRSAQAMQEQYQQLSSTLEKNISDQEASLKTVSEENIARINAMKDAQDATLKSLTQSAEAVQKQYEELSSTLQKNVSDQETRLIDAFEGNMAQIIEQYLLGALGDQFDLKAQLPSIIKQMEENKQAIADDMRL